MKKIQFRIGHNAEKMKQIQTDEGTFYVTRDKGEIYYGDSNGEKKQIINQSCLDDIFDHESSFGPNIIAVLGEMNLNYTKIYFKDDENNE